MAVPTTKAQYVQDWVASYNGPTSVSGWYPSDWVNDMEVSDGYIYVTGYESQFTSNYATVKYDYAGHEQWVRRLVDGQTQQAEALAVDTDGNVYVTGWQNVYTEGIDVVTLKYSPNGEVLWEKRYNNSSHDTPNDMQLDAAGNLYIAGASKLDDHFDVLLLKYDSDGNLLWDRTIDNGDLQDDSGYSLAIDPVGNAIVAGYTEPNAYLVKWSPNGELLWDREFVGFSTNDEWERVETDALGNIYVLGEISPSYEPNHLWTNKYDPDGNILWERNYTGTADKSCYAGNLAITADGGVVVCGQSWDMPNNNNFITIRYAPDGTKLWQRLENAGYVSASSDDVAIDSEGNIYVTGYGYNYSYWEDIITLGYSPDGDLLWTQIYAGPEPDQSDYPQAIAVDENANVFVTGHSWDPETSNNYTTIRYSPVPFVRAGVKIYLEGPYISPGMNKSLDTLISLLQPYNVEPWNYSGGETTTRNFIINNNIVDWVLIELRTGNSASEASIVASTRAALLSDNGVVLDTDGSVEITFNNVASGDYYFRVFHRNHLSVMSSSDIYLSP